MKTNKLKKAFLAVSLSAAMTIPTVTSLGSAMTSYAASNVPFCSDTDNNGAVNIQEDQIYVSRSYYEARANIISTVTSQERNGLYLDGGLFILSDGYFTNLQPLAKYVLSFVVSGDNLSESSLNDMKLFLKFENKDKNSSEQVKPALIVPRGQNTYYVSYEFFAAGETLSFATSFIEDPTLICSKATITAPIDNEDYYQIEARPAGGEKLFIRIKNDESIGWDKMEAWAKRLCIYANSLSVTTGLQLDTFYMNFDYYDCPNHAYSDNTFVNSKNDKYGYVTFNQYASDDVREYIATGKNIITWVELHEIAHSYGVKPSFSDNYTFSDEYFTNARGITAIQNCDNLRDTEIVFETAGYSGKYDTMLNEIYTQAPDCEMFGFASGLGLLPWEQLEAFFAAESDNDPYFTVSRGVANKINQYIGLNIPLSKRYLKFANTIRKLMSLNNNGVYDESKFTRFIVTNFSKELIKEIVTKLELDQDEDYFN